MPKARVAKNDANKNILKGVKNNVQERRIGQDFQLFLGTSCHFLNIFREISSETNLQIRVSLMVSLLVLVLASSY